MDIKILTATKWEKWRVKTFYTKEPETVAWIKNFNGGVFWDIGANIGIYSLYCAYINPSMIVHAFEPMRKNFIRLWQNIFLNNFDSITAHYMCVGNRMGSALFSTKSIEIGSSGGQVSETEKSGEISYRIPIMTGDAVALMTCCTNFFANYPSYIKIDTDGNELDILKGMAWLLNDESRILRSLLVEINNNDNQIFDILSDAGFEPDERYNRLKTRKSDHNMIFRRKNAKH